MVVVAGVSRGQTERPRAADDPASEPKTPPPARRSGSARSRRALSRVHAAFAIYLALSVVLWWNVWSTHPAGVTTCACGDASLFLWFLEWPAYAIAHGHNPFYSTALFHPDGHQPAVQHERPRRRHRCSRRSHGSSGPSPP